MRKAPAPLRMIGAAIILFVGALTARSVYAAKDAATSAAMLHRRLLANGFVRLPSALSRDAALAWGRAVSAAVAKESTLCASCALADMQDISNLRCFGCDPGGVTTPPGSSGAGRRAFVRARRLVELDSSLRELIHSPALAEQVAAAMDVPRLRLYQATAFIKRPGDGPSAWHQDAAAMPLDTDRIATLWLALDDIGGSRSDGGSSGGSPSSSCGLLRFVRGSHLPGVPVPSLRDLSPAEVRPRAVAVVRAVAPPPSTFSPLYRPNLACARLLPLLSSPSHL
jgi:hypothetical protein